MDSLPLSKRIKLVGKYFRKNGKTLKYMKNTLILVVPCYNEEEVLPETTEVLTALLSQMAGQSLISEDSRILYVNDGSSIPGI